MQFLINRLIDQKELNEKFTVEVNEYVEQEEEFSPYAQDLTNIKRGKISSGNEKRRADFI